jgi:D-lactate dehydrogenase
MRVLAYDTYPDQEFAEMAKVEYVDLETLYILSDVISLHCPLTPDTYHIINKETLDKMKNGVMIVNTGRGRLIDTKALIDALKSGKVGAAGLDVYEEESEYFFEDFSTQVLGDDVLARLLTFSNVLITSHQGFFTREALQNIAQTTLENIRDFLDGKPLKNEICYRCGEDFCRKKESGRCF